VPEVQRIRDVEEHLAGEVRVPDRADRLERVLARSRVHDELGVGTRLEERDKLETGIDLLPLRVGRVAHGVAVRARERPRNVARADHDVVTGPTQAHTERPSDDARAENADPHLGRVTSRRPVKSSRITENITHRRR